MNASWVGDGVRLNPEINISVAMAVKDGVVGAVIPIANKQPIAALVGFAARVNGTARRGGRLRACGHQRGNVYVEQPGDVQGGCVHGDHHAAAKRDSGGWRDCGRCGARGWKARHPADDDHDAFERTIAWWMEHGRREFLGELAGAIRETGKVVVRQRLQESLRERCRLPSTTGFAAPDYDHAHRNEENLSTSIQLLKCFFAVAAAVVLGYLRPATAVAMKPLGDGFHPSDHDDHHADYFFAPW